ncbi:tRNA (adenosine(37)-N6)-threonylcarbamoyltransferase complex dimerization subunit type 1 TsaB [Stappia sp. GBMRC 2046]|uniref:tRNA (Adenosine(37)-N6)-threonylcarbamoyltransferase complex dimerization subunit type 1 TsaB n=1 Tax=Stappia sediminis TaxID=2692190 RepID=A0A7X3LXD7_9HYPH|nr:tRNA (adenosine(37)-N6)-threonylcarbamoyltransferase complex dimerization subunit type 1 TsaB [Stappia sediminis]MXN66805.1 tRNA (adenosine(37)-N6)-threonylcarbamoyltransferase complex dimerization subunit type 1 TsaB [Stappia sediminis]
MILLAIDTALSACSAAVLVDEDGERRFFSQSEELGRGHAERLMEMIAEVMAEAGVAFTDLDRIAVTTGPGSFTGLRVGLSVARGLALVLEIPVIGVTTLAAVAQGVRRELQEQGLTPSPVLVILDARRDEIYTQTFGAKGEPLDEPRVARVADLIQAAKTGARLAGSGARMLAEAADLDDSLIVNEAGWPEISDVTTLGSLAQPGRGAPAPLYLRPPDAKPQVRDRRLRV